MLNSYEDLFARVHLDVGACSRPAIMLALRESLRRFCIDTDAMRVTLPAFAAVAGQASYALPMTLDCHARTIEWLRQGDPVNGDSGFVNVGAYMLDRSTPNTLVFTYGRTPIASKANIFLARVSLIPNIHPTGIEADEFFVEQWSEAICQSARAYLKNQKTASWYDPQGSVECTRDYWMHVGRARLSNFTQGRVMNFVADDIGD